MANKFQLQAIISAVDKITPTLKNVRRGVNAAHKSFRDLGSASQGLLGRLGLPASLSFAAIAFGATRAAQASLDYAGATQDAADQTGMHVELLQAYQTAFAAAGLEADGTTEAITKLNKGMAEGAAGKDKGFAELFQRLRIPLRNAKGEITSVEEALPLLADAFEKNENPAVRARMATELFGKSGIKLIPILAQGREGLRKMTEESERLGTVTSKGSIAALDEMGDEIGLIQKQIRAQTAELFGEIAPFLMPIISDIKEWIAANKDLIRSEVGKWVRDVAESVKAWVASGGLTRLKQGIASVVSGIGAFINAIGGVKNLLLGIGALILIGPVASMAQLVMVFARMATYVAPLLLKVLPMLGGAIKAVGAAFLANPILLVVAAIAAAAYLIYENWDGLVDYFSGMWGRIKSVFEVGFFDGLIQVYLEAWQALGNGIMGTIKSIPLIKDLDFVKNIGQLEFATNRAARLTQGSSGASAVANTPLAAAGAMGASTKLSGEMKVRFENAPPGMRVDQGRTNQRSVVFNPDVGYRMATG